MDNFADIGYCFEHYPQVIKDTLSLMRIGQVEIYRLTKETGKVVNGTGISWNEAGSKTPNNSIVVSRKEDGTYLTLSYEITSIDVDKDDLIEMGNFVSKIIELDDAFPNITKEELESLDLTKSCLV